MREPTTQDGFAVDPERPHLGGYAVGGDPYTMEVAIWEHLIEVLKPKSIVDVGAGEGHAARWFSERADHVLAVEGLDNRKLHEGEHTVMVHDYATGPLALTSPHTRVPDWDLLWCCEFVEHIEEQYTDNFLATFKGAKVVAMTHAVPGQAGWHHVNCQASAYWVAKMFLAGFDFDIELSDDCQALSTGHGDRLLVFRNERFPQDQIPLEPDTKTADASTDE